MSRHAHWVGALGALLWTSSVAAEPQGHVALRPGFCGVGEHGGWWEATRFCGSVTADLLLLRERNRDFGLGPYLEVGSAGIWDARFGAGASALLPVTEDFPLVLSLGLYDHELKSAALGGSVFFGARSYNFEGVYNYALGIYASGYQDLGAERASLVSVGLEIDGFFFVAPFLFAIGALR